MNREPSAPIVLPEVTLAGEGQVHCSVHPGHTQHAYRICSHVLCGAHVSIHDEPAGHTLGRALCLECALAWFAGTAVEMEAAQQATRIACARCVRYHLIERRFIQALGAATGSPSGLPEPCDPRLDQAGQRGALAFRVYHRTIAIANDEARRRGRPRPPVAAAPSNPYRLCSNEAWAWDLDYRAESAGLTTGHALFASGADRPLAT